MERYQYTTVENILAKYHRDFRGNEINESDAIEWIGEALGFTKTANVMEEAIAFIKVEGYQCDIPSGLHYVIQIARNNEYSPLCAEDVESLDSDVVSVENGGEFDIVEDSHGNLQGDYQYAYYRPYYDLKYEYQYWLGSNTWSEKFTPVRLADHSFFNTLVCQETNQDIYHSCRDEYTKVGNCFRFSFETGLVAVAYLRQKVDDKTGYPLIPDDESCRNAINYYLMWKIKQREFYLNREGAEKQMNVAESHWLKYIKQFKNKDMMPYGIDDYQDLMEQSMYLIPRLNRYYGFFGNLNQKESRKFNNPDNRNRRYFNG